MISLSLPKVELSANNKNRFIDKSTKLINNINCLYSHNWTRKIEDSVVVCSAFSFVVMGIYIILRVELL